MANYENLINAIGTVNSSQKIEIIRKILFTWDNFKWYLSSGIVIRWYITNEFNIKILLNQIYYV